MSTRCSTEVLNRCAGRVPLILQYILTNWNLDKSFKKTSKKGHRSLHRTATRLGQ